MSQRQNSPQRRAMGGMRPGGHGGPGAMMRGEKAKDFKGTLRKLASYLGKYKTTVLVVWMMAIVSTVLAVIGPKVTGQATDVLSVGFQNMVAGEGGIDFAAIGRIALTLLGLYLLSAGFSYIQGYIMTGVTMKVTFRMRKDLDEKIHRLPVSYFDKVTHGEVLSRITNDVDTVNQSLNQSLTQIITSVTQVIGAIVMMLTISWQLTIVALLSVPLTMFFVSLIIGKSQKHFRNQQEYLGHVNGHIEEMFGSHVLVKAFGGEEQSVKEFNEYNDTLYRSAWRANFLSGLMMPITNIIGNLSYVAICILGGYYTINGPMTIGRIQSFIIYIRQFNQPISQLANISNVLQQTMAAAERVFAFLAEPEEVPEAEHPVHVAEPKGDVRFEHVRFGYDAEQPIIRDFSAEAKPGQKIAIVGPTGAGKTTIVKLLMRFYDVNGGSILVDGYDIRDFTRDDLRAMFGMVLQDTWLFNGTIADNIRYAKLDATDEEVIAAAKAAHVDHFVRTLPDGYQMVLNEEASNVSQGQKQLLTIARAILADPKILILDEATSSVDTRTEIRIQKGMDNLMRGRTSFIIAHRLSTIRNADLILCLNDGDIVEQGTHEELLAKGGFYANLYNSQFEKAS